MDVAAYSDRPQVTIVSARTLFDNSTNLASFALSIDLREENIRPSRMRAKSTLAPVSFQIGYGLTRGEVESALIRRAGSGYATQVYSTSTVFNPAAAQGISLVTISAGQLGVLDALRISADAKARITQAIAGATGQGELLVGAPITATQSLSSNTLAPGSGTVTNTLSIAAQGQLGRAATDSAGPAW